MSKEGIVEPGAPLSPSFLDSSSEDQRMRVIRGAFLFRGELLSANPCHVITEGLLFEIHVLYWATRQNALITNSEIVTRRTWLRRLLLPATMATTQQPATTTMTGQLRSQINRLAYRPSPRCMIRTTKDSSISRRSRCVTWTRRTLAI